MITLYAFSPALGLPDGSPYVLKTEIQLRMAGLDYVKDTTAALPKAPKGKLPFIEDAGETVADSTFIRAHIERKYGFDFDRGLDAVERAEAWAIERMLEDHLYWANVTMRWMIPENFAAGPAHFFDRAPEPMRETIRAEALARMTTTLHGQGLGRHGIAEVVELADRDLAALSALLGHRPWLMGETPCGTDATLTAMLAMLLSPALDSPLRRRALGHANLVAYVDRAMAHFFPDFAWTPIQPEADLEAGAGTTSSRRAALAFA
jgi:glutathione S-transferase